MVELCCSELAPQLSQLLEKGINLSRYFINSASSLYINSDFPEFFFMFKLNLLQVYFSIFPENTFSDFSKYFYYFRNLNYLLEAFFKLLYA